MVSSQCGSFSSRIASLNVKKPTVENCVIDHTSLLPVGCFVEEREDRGLELYDASLAVPGVL